MNKKSCRQQNSRRPFQTMTTFAFKFPFPVPALIRFWSTTLSFGNILIPLHENFSQKPPSSWSLSWLLNLCRGKASSQLRHQIRKKLQVCMQNQIQKNISQYAFYFKLKVLPVLDTKCKKKKKSLGDMSCIVLCLPDGQSHI